MPDNNSMSDIKYKCLLRAHAEWQLTDFAVAPDNPAKLTDAEIQAFKDYRAAWKTIYDGHGDYEIDRNAEMMIKGFGDLKPDFPAGWDVVCRAVGDLPPMVVRKSELDVYDSSYGNLTGVAINNTSPAGGLSII